MDDSDDGLILPYMNLAAAIIKSGASDDAFLRSNWHDTLEQGVTEYVQSKLKGKEQQFIRITRGDHEKD